jgi:hypothetical protein
MGLVFFFFHSCILHSCTGTFFRFVREIGMHEMAHCIEIRISLLELGKSLVNVMTSLP